MGDCRRRLAQLLEIRRATRASRRLSPEAPRKHLARLADIVAQAVHVVALGVAGGEQAVGEGAAATAAGFDVRGGGH